MGWEMEDGQVFQIIIKGCLEAVHEQYVMPLTLAMGTLTAAVCRNPETAVEVAAALRQQAESCPNDVAGRTLLEALAGLAGGPVATDPAAVQSALRSHLRLIQGRPQKDD